MLIDHIGQFISNMLFGRIGLDVYQHQYFLFVRGLRRRRSF